MAHYTDLSSTLVSLVADRLKSYGELPALTFQKKSMSYSELSRKIDQAAAGFQNLGVERGEAVGLFLPNTPFFPVAFHGALKTGAAVSAINSLFEPEQIKHQIKDSNIRTLVTMDSSLMLPKVMEIMNDNDTPLEQVIVGKTTEILPFFKSLAVKLLNPGSITTKIPKDERITLFSDFLNNAGAPDKIDVSPDDIAVLQYTGGTTGGKPKAAMLTHNNIASNILQGLAILPEFEDKQERMLGALPLFHIFGNAMMNLGLHKGAEIYLHPKATDVEDVSRLIHSSKATFMAGTPGLYEKLIPAARKNGHDYSRLKMAISGGDALPMTTAKAFADVAACGIRSGYGMSESPVICVMPKGAEYERGLAGRILPGTDVRITDPESGKTLDPEDAGEITIKGPQLMRGYFNQDDVNARVFTQDGYFKTGDLGKVIVDENGEKSLYITGRLKNVIIRGGHNIYPEDIDGIEAHGDVAETCTFGVPAQGAHGEYVATLIRLKDGNQADAQTTASILGHIADQVGRFDRPNFIAFVDDIPKTKIMKLDRNEALRRVKDQELFLYKADYKTHRLKKDIYHLPSQEGPDIDPFPSPG
ncbi:MAG: AMP-binding protein [Alphaproteobacteria bacterium]